MFQKTLSKSISISGIGLHSGENVQLKLHPAPVDSGIRFLIHSGHSVHAIAPLPDAVSTTELATALSSDGFSVSTVEHLLAALSGLGIDNADCHIYGNEIPILDGSARSFVAFIQKTGTRTQKKPRKFARITRPFGYEKDGKSIWAYPYNGFRVEYTIDFPHKCIGHESLSIDITPESFKEIADARTFGFLQEVEYLHSKNLALGGNLSNAIVLDEEGVINPDGLRYPDEFVRHKILDFIGDMAMFGTALRGRFVVSCSGHRHNNDFLRHLAAEGTQCFELAVEETLSLSKMFFPALSPAKAAVF